MEQENNDILQLLGIKVEDGKIEVDTNKTKSFFESLQSKAQEQAQKIESGIKEGQLDLKESVGLKVEDQKIELDLNKTKSFFENIAQKAATFLESLNSDIQKFNNQEDSSK